MSHADQFKRWNHPELELRVRISPAMDAALRDEQRLRGTTMTEMVRMTMGAWLDQVRPGWQREFDEQEASHD